MPADDPRPGELWRHWQGWVCRVVRFRPGLMNPDGPPLVLLDAVTEAGEQIDDMHIMPVFVANFSIAFPLPVKVYRANL